MTLNDVEMFIALRKDCPEWITLKRKWDGKSPRKGSNAFKEYCNDIKAAEEALQVLVDGFERCFDNKPTAFSLIA